MGKWLARFGVRFLDIVTGRVAHWNSTNNVVITELWDRMEMLSEPQRKSLKSFLVSAGIVVESVIGPGNKAGSVGLRIDLKEISIKQFRDLYDTLLTYFVVIAVRANHQANQLVGASEVDPLDEDKKLMLALERVVSNRVLSRELMVSLGLTGEVDMGQLGGKVWDQIVPILGAGDGHHPGQLVFFSLLAGRAYVEARKGL